MVEQADIVKFPRGYTDAELFKWLHQEVATLLNRTKCDVVGIKKAEPTVRRSNALETRIQGDAIISLVAALNGCLDVSRKVNATIAKGLGLKGKSKYLQTQLDTSKISSFQDYAPKLQEAVLVAWSCM